MNKFYYFLIMLFISLGANGQASLEIIDEWALLHESAKKTGQVLYI